ncbi:MAG: metallophosphoesterase family protein [Candidatus Sumerlaeaceae bacterium]
MRIGVISDTHGFLDSRVYHMFNDVQHILHAGDVGDDRILDELEMIAPVNAVTGNVDGSPTKKRQMKWCGTLFGVRICMTHGHLLDPADYNRSALKFFQDEKPQVVVHGHSHRGKNETQEGVLFLNPGAACKPRFRDVASVAILEIEPGGRYFAQFQELAR